MPGVVGIWLTKDIIAHLASFERVLVEVLASFLDNDQPTPTLDRFLTERTFNDYEVAAREAKTDAEVLTEYNEAHAQVMSLAQRVSEATFRQAGALPWYGPEYALDDLVVYMFYAHKREHSTQIKLFRKRSGR